MSEAAARQWFISCGRGIQGLLANELKALGVVGVQEKNGGVACRDDLEAAYRICLWSRLASRVLMPLRTFSVKSPEDLYQGAYSIDWGQHFTADNSFIVDFSGTGAGIDHTRYGAQRVKDAVVDYFRARDGRRPDVQADWPDIRLNARLHRERVVLSLDFSGESLHQRQYRQRGTVAPLKENLAAALLMRAGWPDPSYAALVDPMCGSGTLLIEAAMMSADVAPGLGRLKHGFEHWHGHRPELWRQLLDEAKTRREQGLAGDLPLFVGYDHHERAIEAASLNIEAAGVDECIRLRQ
ncbi:MAG TPA: 23S rRNA (guanine(2445)-N(2))/(guanine(2069)-N(7))-methyltransferase, partial [Porticoccaceae bacterium]|nr:23S rRNA (guanine(2445)-N(2))/(guanine(2069)-N(7))-methyltransferase [Porticoccaceae bacterium]